MSKSWVSREPVSQSCQNWKHSIDVLSSHWKEILKYTIHKFCQWWLFRVWDGYWFKNKINRSRENMFHREASQVWERHLRKQNRLEREKHSLFWFSISWVMMEGWERPRKKERERERQVSLLLLAIYLWRCSRPSCCWFKVRSLAGNQIQGCKKHPHSHFTYRGKYRETECLWNKWKSQTQAQFFLQQNCQNI